MIDKLFVLGVPTGSVLMNVAIDTLTPETHISLGVALTIGGVVLSACWWLSAKFKSIDDKLESLEKHLRDLPCEGKGCVKDK